MKTSITLSKSTFSKESKSSYPTIENTSTTILALKTLGSFDMKGHNLADFVQDCVVKYLDDDNVLIRKEAAITCCQKLFTEKSTIPIKGHIGKIVSEVIEKLLYVGVTDQDSTIRFTVLKSLDSRFDNFLSLSDNLKFLFIALNDESFEIREIGISVIGRLSTKNPSFILPSLRKTLIQLLTQLEFSDDKRSKEESSIILGHLITATPRLVKPYVPSILKVLIDKINDSNTSVSISALDTTGRLSVVGGNLMTKFLGNLVPLVLDQLQDQSSL
jgi:serine/threonine-protein kinase mTOR